MQSRLLSRLVRVKILTQRFLAFGLDAWLSFVLSSGLLRLVRLLNPDYSFHPLFDSYRVPAVKLFLFSGFRFPVVEMMFLLAIYVVLATRLTGGTIGMRVFDLQMRNARTGERQTWQSVLFRHILSYVSVLAFGTGYLWALVDKHGRTWHDILSGTVVVDDSDSFISSKS